MAQLDTIKLAQKRLETVTNEGQLNQVKAEFLGKKSALSQSIAKLGLLDADKRKQEGEQLNSLRSSLQQLFEKKRSELLSKHGFEAIDLTTPVPNSDFGHLHPITLVLADVYRIFTELGFAIVDGPEIESDWYNFEALNMPPEHPAREMQDTFYLKQTLDGRPLIPRTHTSGMQVRFLENNQPPVKIIVPGKVFRNENEDATHSWIFTQIEGLVVGEGIAVSDLKGTLDHFVRGVLGEKTTIRLRPSFFPYTEPSVEVDAFYQGQWLEMLGAGMVHPRVLENAGIDSTKFSGFAFGVGVERLAQVKFGMTDLRENWRPNLHFLEAF